VARRMRISQGVTFDEPRSFYPHSTSSTSIMEDLSFLFFYLILLPCPSCIVSFSSPYVITSGMSYAFFSLVSSNASVSFVCSDASFVFTLFTDISSCCSFSSYFSFSLYSSSTCCDRVI
jgi:hypothetical protein